MKNVLTLLLTIILCNNLFAQDRITKKNGEELYVWIKEISETKIIYSLSASKDSSIKEINKSDVFMIVFRDGIKEVYSLEPKKSYTNDLGPSKIIMASNKEYFINGLRYSYKGIRAIMKELGNKQIDSLMNLASTQGKSGNIHGFCSIPFGFATLFILSSPGNDNYYGSYTLSDGLTILAIGTGTIFISTTIVNIVHKLKRKKYMREAVDLYNKKIAMQLE